MNIMARLENDMKQHFNKPESAFKPCSAEDIETINKAKADAAKGLEPQSDCPLYVDVYSTEKSFILIQDAQ